MILKKPESNFRRWPLRLSPPSPPLDEEQSTKLSFTSSYEILSDANTREVYDQGGMDALSGKRGGMGGGMDPADVFAQFFEASAGAGMFGFDFMSGGPGRRRDKGQDSTIPYDVTLEDLYNGKSVKMNMEKEAVCSVCKGCVPSYYLIEGSCYWDVIHLLGYRSGARGHAKPKACTKCEGK